MAVNTLRDYTIQQKLSGGMLSLHPETKVSQVLQETTLRFVQEHQVILGGSFSAISAVADSGHGTTGGDYVVGTSGTWSAALLQDHASQTGNIILTLPSVTGTLATEQYVIDNTPTLTTASTILDSSYAGGLITFSPYIAAAAGKLSSTVAPIAGTTNLSYSGYFHANTLSSVAGTTVGSTLDVIGLASLDGGINVLDLFTVAANGNTVVSGTLGVTGISTLTGLLNANGGIAVDGTNFTVSGTTGAVYTASTLGAIGLASLDGGINVADLFTVTALGAIDSKSTLDVDGLSSLDGGINVLDLFTVAASGAINTLSTLNASGLASLDGGLDINGIATINSGTGNIVTSGDLALNGGDITSTATTFNIGAANVTTLSLGNSATSVVVPGNLTIEGTATTVNSTTVQISDRILELAKDNTVPLTGYAGLVVSKYDGTNDGGILIDVNGEFRVGDVTISGADVIDVSTVPLLARAEAGTFVDGDLLVWENATLKAVGKTLSEAGIQPIVTAGTALTFTGATLNHDNYLTAGTVSGSTGAIAFGGIVNIPSVTYNAQGHVISTNITQITLPTPSYTAAANDTTITIAAGSGLITGGSFTTNQATPSTITVSHADTSTQASVDNSNGTVIQDVTLDTFGHVSALASVDLDSRYYTESEVSVLNVAGTSPVNVGIVAKTATVSLNAAYGDTVNPYASKLANTILAAPNGSAGVPSFRTFANDDLPDSGVVAGTYTATVVNTKGLVTAGAYSIEVGSPAQTAPSTDLIIGGLFFLDKAVV